MAIYYSNNNKIYTARRKNDVVIQPFKVPPDQKSMPHSIKFGTDDYILDRVTYKPIFKLYHKIFQ